MVSAAALSLIHISPLTVNDRLGDMVTFVNFNDTTSVEESSVQQISLGAVSYTHLDVYKRQDI